MEYFDCLGNESDYLDYLIHTQNGWNLLGYLTSREQYRRAFEALEHKDIINLAIGSFPDGPIYDSSLLKSEDIFILARNLASKTSLKRIRIHNFPSNAEPGMCALFNSLSTCPLVKLRLTRFALTPIVFESFLNILRQCTSLQELEVINMQLDDDKVDRMMAALDNNEELTKLNISYNDCTFASSLRIADFIRNHKKEIVVEDAMPTMNEEEAKEFIARLGDSTSLISYYFPAALTEANEFISRNYQIWQEKLESAKKAAEKLEEEPPKPISIQNLDLDFCGLMMMPDDIMKIILYQIDLKSIIQLRQTDKYCNEMIQKSKFWREYYLKHFYVIPNDVLEITDYTYGLQLIDDSNHTSTPTFWELIFRYSFLVRNIRSDSFPCNLNRGNTNFMNEVYRHFPQLIGTSEWSQGHFENLPPKQWFDTKKSPYMQYWFMSLRRTVYHLGLEKDGDSMNAILLLTDDFSSGWEDRFKYLKYVVEWTTANNEKEFVEKIKPIIDIYLNVRLSPVLACGASINSKNEKIYERVLTGVKDNRSKLLLSLDNKIQEAAKKSWSDLRRVFTDTRQFCQMIEKFKSMIDNHRIHSADYSNLKQHITPRSSLFDKYRSNHGPFVFSFEKHEFIPSSSQKDSLMPHNTNSKKKKRRESKIHGPVALMTFYRMMINLIVMPILEALWMISRSDPDFLLDPHYLTFQKLRPLYHELFRDVTLTRFSEVSVRRAHPPNWPMTALAVANRIADPLSLALQYALSTGRSKSEPRTNPDPIQQLEQELNLYNELLSQQHINALLQLIRKFTEP